jgi:hypothetical protein
MSTSPLSLSRRHVLGGLYPKCKAFTEDVPVYLAGDVNELLGFADQSLGVYADAYTFHLADDVCKRMSAGQYLYEFDVEESDLNDRFDVKTIFLRARKSHEKPKAAKQ